ncbi:MAG TPA: FG-GAP-like repeat-containing protein [Nostocaceae cyanobacterium]|nr:FG-GAP-like repeat-containing protein [Nostocaceae cyanobacterium]
MSNLHSNQEHLNPITGLDTGLSYLSNNSLNPIQPISTSFNSQQLLTLAGETLINAWQNQSDAVQALVYVAGSIFNTNFAANAQIAFGEAFDINQAEALGAEIFGGNYGVLPNVQFLFNGELNGANGAYAESTNTIYIDSVFLAQNLDNPTAIGKVLVEETAHFLDAYASPIDSPGDEGEILAELVAGKNLNNIDLIFLKSENDSSIININNQSVAVEFASPRTQVVLGTRVDFNGDGRTDFLRQEKSDWDNDSNNTVNIFFSNGNATFWKSNLSENFDLKGDKTNLIFGDFNGDGRSDFIRQERSDWDDDSYNTANIFFSNGNGSFNRVNLPEWYDLKGDLTNIFIGDFNGDGRSDFLRQEKGHLASDSYNTANVFFSNGNGSFNRVDLPEWYDLKGDLTNIFIGDFNGDNRSDFLRQEKGHWDDDTYNTANVFLSNGNGNFNRFDLPNWYDLKGDLTNLLIGDFNGDGNSDFIRQERGGWDTDNSNTANIFLSYGNGSFSRRDLTDWSGMKGDKVNILVGDFNGDGRSDFIRQEKDSWDDDNVGTAQIYTSHGNGIFWSRELTDWWDMKGDLANIFTGGTRRFINEITGDIANRGLYKDWWGNIKEDEARYYNDGVNLYRFDGDGKTYQGIESGKETIVFIHGWKGNSDQSNFSELMKELSRQNPYKQILALDWRAPAQHDKDGGLLPNYTARAIAPVAQWATSSLKSLGIEASQLSLVGFSLGSHVAAEIGHLYGKVASLTVLDPAYPASRYDIDGNQIESQRAKNFNEAAHKSIALVVSDEDSGWAGDNERAATANYSFLVRYTNYSGEKDSFYHGSVVTVFRKLIERRYLPSSFAMNQYGNSAESGYFHEGYFTANWRNSDWQPDWFSSQPGSNRIYSWV